MMLSVSLLVFGMMALARANDSCPIEELDDNDDDDDDDDDDDEIWNDFHGRCYLFVATNLTWAQAEKNCRSMEANLASVHSKEEYLFIRDLTILTTHSRPETWIGGTDCQEDQIWFWSDGTDFKFSMWSPGQPDDLSEQKGCIQINHGVNHQWDDARCSDLRPSVCAKSQ